MNIDILLLLSSVCNFCRINSHKMHSLKMGDEMKKEETEDTKVEEAQLEKDYIIDSGTVMHTKGKHAIHCLTVIGQIEGHSLASQNQKTTKYEHVIPQLVSVQEDPEIEALLVILNTVGEIGRAHV